MNLAKEGLNGNRFWLQVALGVILTGLGGWMGLMQTNLSRVSATQYQRTGVVERVAKLEDRLSVIESRWGEVGGMVQSIRELRLDLQRLDDKLERWMRVQMRPRSDREVP